MKITKFILFFLLIATFRLVSNATPSVAEDDEILPNKCGTSFSAEKKNKIFNLLNLRDSSLRPVQHKKFTSASGFFCIHYDTTGKNAVELTDENFNGIPDYVDSAAFYFDYAYTVEIDSMKYTIPATDSGLGGSNAYDVYLLDLGNGYYEDVTYGFTTRERELEGNTKYPKYTSFITIDNNFSSRDSMLLITDKKKPTYNETGIAALKITAAHEFHHAIQFMYGEDYDTPSLNEMTSTYMEYRLFPATTDYIQFVRNLFNNMNRYIFGNGNASNGYRYAIFGQYLQKYYGDELLKKMWENVSAGYSGYDALERAFVSYNSSLATEWSNFIPWLYYTGHRAKPGQYFAQAKDFPQMKFYIDTIYTSPSFLNAEALKPFEIRAFRCRFLPESPVNTNDTLDIVIANTDTKSAVSQYLSDKLLPYIIVCTETFIPKAKRIGNTKYYYTFAADSGNIVDSLFINFGFSTNAIEYAYPNPYNPDTDAEIFFPVQGNARDGDKVLLRIFNSSMKVFYEKAKLPVTVHNGNKMVKLDNLPDGIREGVYIFSIEWGEDVLYGKFTVVQ